jgi:hypothetical protein
MVPRGWDHNRESRAPCCVGLPHDTPALYVSPVTSWSCVLRKTLLTEITKFRYLSTKLRLRRKTAAARLLGLRVRIPPGAWMSVSYECCVLCVGRADHSSRGDLPRVVCLSVIVKPRTWESRSPLRVIAPGGRGRRIYRTPHATGIVTVELFGKLLLRSSELHFKFKVKENNCEQQTCFLTYVKVKQSRYRPAVAQRVPGS